MHTCPKCSVVKDDSQFQLYKDKANGWCRSCRTQLERERRAAKGVQTRQFSRIEKGKKLCLQCGLYAELSSFSQSPRGLGGVAAYCKPCFAKKYRDAKKAQSRTAKYRRLNRERYLAAHRVRAFERRMQIKVTRDGTVTDEFLKELYGQEFCHYCRKFTEVEERTADR